MCPLNLEPLDYLYWPDVQGLSTYLPKTPSPKSPSEPLSGGKWFMVGKRLDRLMDLADVLSRTSNELYSIRESIEKNFGLLPGYTNLLLPSELTEFEKHKNIMKESLAALTGVLEQAIITGASSMIPSGSTTSKQEKST